MSHTRIIFSDRSADHRWMAKIGSTCTNCCFVQGTQIHSSLHFGGAHKKSQGSLPLSGACPLRSAFRMLGNPNSKFQETRLSLNMDTGSIIEWLWNLHNRNAMDILILSSCYRCMNSISFFLLQGTSTNNEVIKSIIHLLLQEEKPAY